MLRKRLAVLVAVMALVPTMLITAPAAAQDAGVGTVTVVHGIPEVAVDVYVDNDLTLEGFEFGDVAGPLDLPAASYDVEVTLAGTTTTVLGPETVSLAAGDNLTVAAHLDYQETDESTPQLSVFANDVSRMGTGNATVAVRHLADAPAVDLWVDTIAVVEDLANPDEESLTVVAAAFDVALTDAEDADEVFFEDELTFRQGYTYALHAVGSTDDDSFDVIVQQVSPFVDVTQNIHRHNIVSIAASGITRGCNPPVNNLFCPGSTVTRGQMAAFLARALELPPSDETAFADIADNEFAGDINALAEAKVAYGFGDGTFRPRETMTRGQMAAFLNRAFQPEPSDTDAFTDDDGHLFENDINAIAAAGIALGCNPPENDNFCPMGPIRRDQMASFLARGLDID